jgi:phage regulator Rha-like protein
MSILNLLQGLANAAPNSHEIDELVNAQPKNIQDAIKNNNNDALKNMISSNQFYANETKVTLY